MSNASAFLFLSLLALKAFGIDPCKKITLQAADQLTTGDTYTELQELLIAAESSSAPGVADKLEAEFQVKLSEYHAKLVASGAFTGALDELIAQIAASARERQKNSRASTRIHDEKKSRVRRSEDRELWTTKLIETSKEHGKKAIIAIELFDEGKSLYLYDEEGTRSIVRLRDQHSKLQANDGVFDDSYFLFTYSDYRKHGNAPWVTPLRNNEWAYEHNSIQHEINVKVAHGRGLAVKDGIVSRDGHRVYLAGDFGKVSVVNLDNLESLEAFLIPEAQLGGGVIRCLAESLDGNTLYVGGENGLAAAINLKPILKRQEKE